MNFAARALAGLVPTTKANITNHAPLSFLPSRQVQRAINRHLAKLARHEEWLHARIEKRFRSASLQTKKGILEMKLFRERNEYPEAFSLEESRYRH